MIEKVRVHEIAKELGIASKDVLEKAKELGLIVKSAQSICTMEQAEKIAEFIINNDKIPPINKKSLNIHYSSSKSQFNNINLTIQNLKSIKELTWSIQYNKGVHAIIAENGTGKSSLIISLAKLVQPNIYSLEFIGKGYEDTRIIFNLNEDTYEWKKQPIWSLEQSKISMPKINGLFESSVHNGTRFKKIDTFQKEFDVDVQNDNIIEADSFIQKNMNYILYGDTDNKRKFTNLYFIRATRRRKTNNSIKQVEYRFYALKNDKTYIKEFFFSTGEYFLLSLIQFVFEFRNNINKSTSLIIIDEIELSLHPLAQKRLMEKVNEFAQEFNLLFIFATHSLQIIENLKPSCIHYLNNINGKCKIFNPIYPNYLSSKLYIHNSFDYVFLVEDDLAKQYLEKVIRKNLKKIHLSFIILPIGGWEKIYETYSLNSINKFYGSAKIQIVLDGDVTSIKEANTNKYKKIPKLFLPFLNIENLIVSYYQNNDKFVDLINTYIFEDLNILDVEVQTSTTKDIKKTFKKIILEFSKYSQKSEEETVNIFIDFILEYNKEDEKYRKFEADICNFLDGT